MQEQAASQQNSRRSLMEVALGSDLRLALSWQLLAFVIAAVSINVSIIIYGVAAPASVRLRVIGMLLVFGITALAAGGLVGFLFGVPRNRTSTGSDSSTATNVPARTDATGQALPNTNLEQISDWLTKVLVGVSLAQIGNIGSGASRLFQAMARGLGAGESDVAFVGALVIYSAAIGFMAGWLTASVWIAWTVNAFNARTWQG
jgi:hypothetical protein